MKQSYEKNISFYIAPLNWFDLVEKQIFVIVTVRTISKHLLGRQ